MIFTWLGNLLNFGEDISPALVAGIEALIPSFKQDDVNARMRVCKWKCKHNKNIVPADIVRARLMDLNLTDEELSTLTNLLIEEIK